MLGPLMPTLKPNNRDKFWAKSQTRRELDKIGWTGKHIYSDSSEEEEEENSVEEICERAEETSGILSEHQRDEYYHNTNCKDYWNDVYFPSHSDISGSQRECKDDGVDSRSSSSSQTLKNTATSNTLTEDERDDCCYKTSGDNHSNSVCSSYRGDVSDFEREVVDNHDNSEDDWFDGEEFAEEIVVNWVVGILSLVLVLGGAWCVVSMIH